MKRWLSIGLAVAMLLSLLVGCGEQQDRTEGQEALQLTVSATEKQTSLDPAYAIRNNGETIAYHLYENLLRWEDDGEGNAVLAPGMARDYVVEENDGFVLYTFYLRSDLKWSDGKKITAEDFVYAWQRLFGMEDPPVEVYQMYMVQGFNKAWAERDGSLLLGVSAPNSSTVEIRLTEHCAYFLDLFCAGTLTMPVRKDVVLRYGDNWGERQTAQVGNGPYAVKEMTADGITVVKNEHYYDAENISVDEITFRWTGDAASNYRALTEGTLDFVGTLPEEEVLAREESGTLTVESVPATYTLLINQMMEPFDDPFVRMAFAACVDQAEATAAAGVVTNTVATGLVPHGITNRDDLFEPPEKEEPESDVVLPEDLLEMEEEPEIRWDYRAVGDYGTITEELTREERAEKAQRLLSQGGYPAGRDFPEIPYYYVNTPENQAVAEYLRDQWQEMLNVRVELVPMTEDDLRAALLKGEFGIAAFKLEAAYDDAMAFLKRWQSTTSVGAGNLISYNNRAYDLLIYVVAETGSNSAREACLHDAEALLLEDCGVVPLYYYGRTSQLAEELMGLYSMADETRFFRNVTVKPVEPAQ